MYCTKCGNYVTSEQKFCAHCGAAVESSRENLESKEKEQENIVPANPSNINQVQEAEVTMTHFENKENVPIVPNENAQTMANHEKPFMKPRKTNVKKTLIPVIIGFIIIGVAFFGLFIFFKPDTTLDGTWSCMGGVEITLKNGDFTWSGVENNKDYTTKGSFSISEAALEKEAEVEEAKEKGYKFYYATFIANQKILDSEKQEFHKTQEYKIGMGSMDGQTLMLIQNEDTSSMYYCSLEKE